MNCGCAADPHPVDDVTVGDPATEGRLERPVDEPSVPTTGMLHHVELWVPDLPRAVACWGWLMAELGYIPFQDWSHGASWRLGATYLVVERSPALTADRHDRCRPGLNHLAFHVRDRAAVDRLVERAPRHGWTLLFPERHPHAGGEEHYAAYLANADGFEVELVAVDGSPPA